MRVNRGPTPIRDSSEASRCAPARAPFRYHAAMGNAPNPRIREEIAAAAARLVAESGLDFASAKRKAAREVAGTERIAHDLLPGNEEIEAALREYQRLFQADTQPARLRQLRQTALAVMELLPQHDLYLVGAVANGTAGEHSELYLQYYIESSKDLHIDLLNAGFDADADEISNPFGRGRVERVRFLYRGECVNITCYPPNKARQIGEQLGERLDYTGLVDLLDADATNPDEGADPV
jgi:hypothetical protein